MQKKWKRTSQMVDFILSSFLTYFLPTFDSMLSSGNLQYRLGTMDDFYAIKELSFISYSEFAQQLEPAEWDKMRSGLFDDGRLRELMEMAVSFVCTLNDAIIGVAFFVPPGNPTNIFEPEWCYIRKVGVNPGYRGLGIAKKLTALIIDYARQIGEYAIMLHTSEMMPAARHVYEGIGFQVWKNLDPIFGKQYWLYRLDLGAQKGVGE